MTSLRKIAVLTCLLSSGCAVGPRYQRPMVQAAPAPKEMAGNDIWKMATPSDDLMKGKWWEIFGDPQLNRLEELVGVNNFNVKQAEAQFREAQATVLSSHANYYPTIGSNPGITQSRNYESRGTVESFSLPAAASWEPDLWGRVRLSVENAVANAQVSAADLENLRLSQQALLATDYFLLAAQDMQMEVLRTTIESYDKNLQLTINRHAGGVASRSDITLAQTQLAGAKAQYTDLHVARAQDEHAIAVLTGQDPSSFSIGPTKIAAPPPPIPMGVPSQLLERRPDIAANERQMAAANANIGIAQTAYYPSLTLSATPRISGFGFHIAVQHGQPLLVRRTGAFLHIVRFWPARSGVTERAGGIRFHRRLLPADGIIRISGSGGRSRQSALPFGRSRAAAGRRRRRPRGAGSGSAAVSRGNGFVPECHHHPDHRAG